MANMTNLSLAVSVAALMLGLAGYQSHLERKRRKRFTPTTEQDVQAKTRNVISLHFGNHNPRA